MKDYSDIFSKAGQCMESALRMYCEGDITGGNRMREEANRLYDLAENYVNSDAGKISSLYGENRNFGIILKVIMENINHSNIGKKNVRRTLKEVVTTIKGDPVLQSQYDVYHSLSENVDKEHLGEYVDRSLSFVDGLSRKQIRASNERLINVIRNFGLNEMVDIPDSQIEKYELIENAILSRVKRNDVGGYLTAVRALNEELISDGEGDELTADEEKLIEDVLNDDNEAEQRFNESKAEALGAIKETADKSGGRNEELEKIYEDINSREFRPGYDAIKDIAEFEEITNVINN